MPMGLIKQVRAKKQTQEIFPKFATDDSICPIATTLTYRGTQKNSDTHTSVIESSCNYHKTAANTSLNQHFILCLLWLQCITEF